MKTEEGLVIEVVGNLAKVKAGKHNDCKNCGACPGNDSAIITVKNDLVAKPGQRVNFQVKESNEIKGAFIIFVLPLLAASVGVILGNVFGRLASINTDAGMLIGGVAAFLSAVVFIKFFDKSVARKERSLPTIISIEK